jgi:ketosteroid isomerase-like protein
MNTAQLKQTAQAFFDRFNANDIPGVLATLSEDATYWIGGRREVLPSAGCNSKARFARILQAMAERLTDDGLRMQVKGMIAEGDRVAVEVESHGTLKNGRVYNNQYHVLMRIADGKIVEAHEYFDTQHALATWYQ